MRYSIVFMAAAAAVNASPFPQAVTSAIAPEAPAPSGCMTDYSGTFGIAVMNVTSGAAPAPATGMPDASGMPASSAPVSSIADGQPQASTGAAPVTTIADGQPQASTGAAPVSTIADGQPQAPTMTVAPVSQISDGQIQATSAMTMVPINQITDGQIQNQMTVAPVSQISDGQIQATSAAAPVSTIADGQPQAPTGAPVSTIADGQPQAPTGAPVSTIADGQPQAPTSAGAPPVSTIADGQPQASSTASASSAESNVQMVACQGDDSLQVTLEGGVLTDNQGRTGYIAANYQFQFDGPPQAGAIYTSGFSVCGNGSLALGGSTIFYQCLSGDFFNLYDRDWAPQCNPITINVVNLVDCSKA